MVKLRERIDGPPPRRPVDADAARSPDDAEPEPTEAAWAGGPVADDSLIAAKAHLGEALDELSAILQSQAALAEIDSTDRQNLAKYLTIAKLRLENAINQVRLMEQSRS